MRLIQITPDVDFKEFSVRLKEKMGMKKQCKFKVKDEDGEMILVADQEDLDMAVSMSKKAAKKAKSETGKMEVSFFFFCLLKVTITLENTVTDGFWTRRFGYSKLRECIRTTRLSSLASSF
jgi:hypothetical protein